MAQDQLPRPTAPPTSQKKHKLCNYVTGTKTRTLYKLTEKDFQDILLSLKNKVQPLQVGPVDTAWALGLKGPRLILIKGMYLHYGLDPQPVWARVGGNQ